MTIEVTQGHLRRQPWSHYKEDTGRYEIYAVNIRSAFSEIAHQSHFALFFLAYQGLQAKWQKFPEMSPLPIK